ncbi:MAG: VCBS repeat-containing protein [Planctomycetales bacterium]|nr:VCBS repeat-containing protein [Planctomycetales bacterium]
MSGYSKKNLRCESLESKELLAADVVAPIEIPASVDVTFLSGHFTGASSTDLVAFVNGDFVVSDSQSDSFRQQYWADSWEVSGVEDTLVGDINGDGYDDIVARRVRDGVWFAAVSDGSKFHVTRWGRWSTEVDWLDVSMADVDGDGADEIVGRTNHGEWWMAQGDGFVFSNVRWGRWNATVPWSDVDILDVDQDGKDDIVGRTSGDWWATLSKDGTTVNQKWGHWSDAVDWDYVEMGDIDGDGFKDDVIGRIGAGAVWASVSDGQGFSNHAFPVIPADQAYVDLALGDIDGDGDDDLVARNLSTGEWLAIESDGTSGSLKSIGSWETHDWFNVQVNDFDGDGVDDILGQRMGILSVSQIGTDGLLAFKSWSRWVDSLTPAVVEALPLHDDVVDDSYTLPSDIETIFIGDSNRDGVFDSSDLITIFQRGKYERGYAATFEEGDWNRDGVFGSGDFVIAFQDGNYQSE